MFDVSTFGIKEWTLLIGGLAFLLIVLDGLRRVFLKSGEEVVLSKHAKKGYEDGVAMDAKDAADAVRVRYELPSKPRVVKRDGEEASNEDLLDKVPTLDQPVEKQLDFDELIKMASSDSSSKEEESAESFVLPESKMPDSVEETNATEPTPSDDDEVLPKEDTEKPQKATASASRATKLSVDKSLALDNAQIDDVVAIYVRSNQSEGFDSSLLEASFIDLDLVYGGMDILHLTSAAVEDNNILYSVANAVEPGTFDVNKLESFATPCIVFFMQLPGPERPINAFREMLDGADKIAKKLDGTLLDEQRNLLHQQSLVHIHEKLQELSLIHI